jgi:hypothetical protein
VVDGCFGANQRRLRQGAAAETAALLRRIASNVGRPHPRHRLSIRSRRLVAGGDGAYLFELLTGL